MSSVLGLCIGGHDLSEFQSRHWNDGLFRGEYGGHHFAVKPLDTYLQGQRELPQSVLEFQDKTTALVALEISREWVGTVLVKWWRIIYIHPELDPIFLQEAGEKLRDIPIGDNERIPLESEEGE